MAHGRLGTLCTLLVALALAAFGPNVYAQGSATSTLAGTVVDSTGAMVPGADVTAKNTATGATFTAVSASEGAFTIPAIPTGTYTVSVALMGFKTAVLNGVTANVGVTATVKAVLELGRLEETVVVEAASQIVQTQATSVSATLTVKQISNLPLPGRGAFEFVNYMPGVTSSTGSSRGSTVNGLPQSAVNITLDGMNIQDNYMKTQDGMFARVSPRLDAVEEITIGTAAQGAEGASQGGVQVRFVTRSGTNQFRGSLYYYAQNDRFNTNTWFNTHYNVDAAGEPTKKPVQNNRQPGGRLGGPVVIPGLFDGHDKLFFFVNYELTDSPGTLTLNRTIMSPNSENGLFQYGAGTVDLYALAAKYGQVTTPDPMVKKILNAIRSSTSQGIFNATTDPLTQVFSWQQPSKGRTTYPTVRLDDNIAKNHRWSASMTQNHLISDPDQTNSYWRPFPNFPVHGSQDSKRYSAQTSVRSLLSSSLVNEVRLGATGGSTLFAPELAADMFTDWNGYGVIMNTFKAIANPYQISANSSREASTKVIEDTLNWVTGKHNVSAGVSYTRADVWLANQQHVPTLTLGMATGDPADSMFTVANFPDASSTDLTNAKNLYAVLTGRISAIGRNARIGEDGETYSILGESMQKGRLREFGFHLSDSWRLKPNLTVNAGLRYELQLPFYALNNSYSMATMDDIFGITGVGSGLVPGKTVSGIGNLFKPGTLQGTATTYKMYSKATKAYNTDKNNLAPSFGVAWTTGAQGGLLHTILGNPGDSVLRGGWSIAYQRPGMSDFTAIYGSNPGVAIDASRNLTNGNLGTLPVLLRSSDLSAPGIGLKRQYPMAVPNASSSVYAFDPDIKVPWSTSFTVGWQRALGKNMSVEARFIHTASHDQWTVSSLSLLNYNELNIVENGFLDEFRLAQANLVANIAAGKGSTFAYTGVAGTSPLPIYLGYLNGSTAGGDPSKYTGSGWTNSAMVQTLYALNPNPCCSTTTSAAGLLRTNATYNSNAAKVGLPANLFVANPSVSGAYVAANGPDTRYNGAQFLFTRRFSQGFQLQANYSYGKGYQDVFYSFRKPLVEREQNYSNSGSGQASGNVRHVFAANWVLELPLGQGKRWGSHAGGFLNRLIGNWSYMGTARIQSGRMVDFGNVKAVGMTPEELVKSFELRLVTDPANQYRTLVYMLPQDIIDNTIKAFDVTASGYGSKGAPTGRYLAPANNPSCMETAPGYGDCGAGSLIVTGPKVMRFDMSLVKEIPVVKSVSARLEWQVFNVFNRTNFTPNAYSGTNPDSYQITGAVDQSRTMQLAARISW